MSIYLILGFLCSAGFGALCMLWGLKPHQFLALLMLNLASHVLFILNLFSRGN